MFRRDQRFPISTGPITIALRTALSATAYSAGLSVGAKLPQTLTRRMVTVRDDGGSTAGRIQSRRQGVNVWADNPVDAEKIALEIIHIAESVIPDGSVVSGTSGFVGPYEVDDDVPFVVGGKNLTHFFVSFIADVKAYNA